MKYLARVFVAHPDDCIIYFWHLITSLPCNWEIVYLTHTENSSRSNEIKKFWASHNVTTSFLGFADDINDLKSGMSSINSDDIYQAIFGLVKSSDVVCTHSAHGEYGHPHHKQLSDIVSKIDHPRIVYVSNCNLKPDLILSSDKVIEHSLIPIHSKAVSHYINNNQSHLFGLYNFNYSRSYLIDTKDYERNLVVLVRKLSKEYVCSEQLDCIINILYNLQSSILFREFCHFQRRSGNYQLAEKYLKLSESLNSNAVYPFDWALIEKSKGNYRISEAILLRLHASFKRDDYLLELLESAIYRGDLNLFRSLLMHSQNSTLTNNPRFINFCKLRSSYSSLMPSGVVDSHALDVVDSSSHEVLYRSPKDYGELAKFHNYIVSNKHALVDDLFVDYSNLRLSSVAPRDIFTFWDQPIPPDFVSANFQSWKALTDCQTPIFNFDLSQHYIRDLFGQEVALLFEKLPHPASQSDFFRLAKLYSDGGIYIDADEFMHGQLNSLLFLFDSLKCQRFLICDIVSKQVYIQNHFMIVRKPKDSLIECALNNSISSIKLKQVLTSKDIWNLTGPGCLTRAYIQLMEPELNSSTVFISSIAFRRYFNNANKNYDALPNANWRELI